MIVMKFGGSSVATSDRIRHVGSIVEAYLSRKPVVVLSAMGDTTDHLLEAANRALNEHVVYIEQIRSLHITTIDQLNLGDDALKDILPLFEELDSLLTGISLIRELTGRTKDYLVSFGERLSVRITAAYLNSVGIRARAFDAWDIGFISDSNYTAAELDKESWDRVPLVLNPLLDDGVVPVVTGFIAKDRRGNITTLGRGGSDRSATIIAAAMLAEEAQVWKDVDGILTADPRLVPDAHPVEEITYEEAAELAYFGSQILHPRAMQPCKKTNTPVLVKNSYNPEVMGTRIVLELTKNSYPIRAITTKRAVTLIDIVSTRMLGQSGFLAEVFSAFSRHGLSVDMVATSEVSISLTLDAANGLGTIQEELEQIANIEIKTNKAIVTIVGDVSHSAEILQQAFGVCAELAIPVQMISQGASKVNVSFIVDDREAEAVVRGLHAHYFPSPAKLLQN